MRLTSLFIYLSTSRWRPAERMCFLTHSFSSPLFPPSFPSSISPVAHSGIWTRFRVQNIQHEVRGKVVREPGRQTGTSEGALESQVVVSERSRVCVLTYVLVIVPLRLLHFSISS